MKALQRLCDLGVVDRAVPLGSLTTYKFGGPAAYLGTVDDVATLRAVTAAAVEAELPVLVLGRGSNTVISDAGFDGVVVTFGPGLSGIDIGQDGMVHSGAGAPLPLVARTSVRANRGGLEFLVGIPGSAGGAVAMNAGCHGSETSEWLLEALVLEVASGHIRTEDPTSLDMSYRHSAIGPEDVVVAATWRSVERDRAEGEAILRDITRWRKEHQPGGTFNAGSVFKNPPGDAAGRIIDELGLKGHRIGSVAVSERHGNFFVAEPDASAQDVHDLVSDVRSRVLDATGIALEPEIRFVGEFHRG